MKTQGGVAGTPIGTPDIVACGANGNFVGIEVKKMAVISLQSNYTS